MLGAPLVPAAPPPAEEEDIDDEVETEAIFGANQCSSHPFESPRPELWGALTLPDLPTSLSQLAITTPTSVASQGRHLWGPILPPSTSTGASPSSSPQARSYLKSWSQISYLAESKKHNPPSKILSKQCAPAPPRTRGTFFSTVQGLLWLPEVILHNMFTFLQVPAIHRFSCVSRKAAYTCKSKDLWLGMTINLWAAHHGARGASTKSIKSTTLPPSVRRLPPVVAYYCVVALKKCRVSTVDLLQLQSVRFSLARFCQPLENATATYRIFVKAAHSGQITHFESDLSCDVHYLKRSIEEQEGIPVEEQMLVYDGLIMEDDRRLFEYDLCYRELLSEECIRFVHVLALPLIVRSMQRCPTQPTGPPGHNGPPSLPTLALYTERDGTSNVIPLDGRKYSSPGLIKTHIQQTMGLNLNHIQLSGQPAADCPFNPDKSSSSRVPVYLFSLAP